MNIATTFRLPNALGVPPSRLFKLTQKRDGNMLYARIINGGMAGLQQSIVLQRGLRISIVNKR